ncbi:hypothetical protein LTR17_003422 [Elasticomyces elasticus]|nr:hypothetical protein LTR17_003422 [Elasticomyces elasticus]
MVESKCLLLTLPPELLNQIWNLVLPVKLPDNLSFRWFAPPNILQVNRQIRADTLPMYYGQTTFEISIRRASDFYSGCFTSIGHEAVGHIRRMRFHDCLDYLRGYSLVVTPRANTAQERVLCKVNGAEYIGTDERMEGIIAATKDALEKELDWVLLGFGTFKTRDWVCLIWTFNQKIRGR